MTHSPNSTAPERALAVEEKVSEIPPELAAMLEAAWKSGYVAGCGYVPDAGLDDEARREVAMLPVLGRIGDVKLSRVKILKR